MTIKYGKDVELPDELYNRAIAGCRVDSNGHWIWYGASSGKHQHPQIGSMGLVNGERKLKVVSVAKLLYVVMHHGFFPWQVRRDKSVCTDKRCVNPDHFYAIPEKPEPRAKGNRGKRVKRDHNGEAA